MADVPIGTVISYVGAAASLQNLMTQGWLVCNGNSVSKVTYPDLFLSIGTSFGGDGAPNFNLPDLRGMFLRGIDMGASRDPDVAARTPQEPNGNHGDAVGSRQSDQLRNHQHNWDHNFFLIGDAGSDIAVQQPVDSPRLQNHRGPTTNIDGGGNETRPANVYVYYLIKAHA